MSDNIFGVILAGGSGSRLWPLSRELYPKQLIKLDGDNTLFQSTFLRMSQFVPIPNILTITNIKHYSDLKLQLGKVDTDFKSKFLVEPVGRNTSPAIGLASFYIMNTLAENEADPIMVVAPSDHIIKDSGSFVEAVKKGIKLAENGYIATLGVEPDKPDTGYGYICTVRDDKLSEIVDNVFKVVEFKEKPNLEEAKIYIQQKNYYWNSGIFIFKASVLIDELNKYAHDIYKQLSKMTIKDKSPSVDYNDYVQLQDISIDYSVMEKSDLITLVPLDSGWNDLGSWESIYEFAEKDENQNYRSGNSIDINSKNSLIYSTSKLVTTVGLKDTIVVETDDAILVCDKAQAQDVKKIYNILKESQNSCYLSHTTIYRPWGYFTILNKSEGFQIKILSINPEHKLSYQMHYHRNEHWTVVYGIAKVIKDGQEIYLKPGESVDIPATVKHSIENPGKLALKIIEVQMGAYLEEDDILRFTDIYGRLD